MRTACQRSFRLPWLKITFPTTTRFCGCAGISRPHPSNPWPKIERSVVCKAKAEESLTTEQKAFVVNMDLAKYGAFAEIGAGQEVARWFFRAGGAAGTVAKTILGGRMDVSNSFYGKTDRYVSRQRLETMPGLRIWSVAGRNWTQNAARNHVLCLRRNCRGYQLHTPQRSPWRLGMKFQRRPRNQPSEIMIHCVCSEKIWCNRKRWDMGVDLVTAPSFILARS